MHRSPWSYPSPVPQGCDCCIPWVLYCCVCGEWHLILHYCDVIMVAMASQITSLTIVYATVHSGADQRKHQSSASLAFVWGIHRSLVNSPHKWPVTREIWWRHYALTATTDFGRNSRSLNRRIILHWLLSLVIIFVADRRFRCLSLGAENMIPLSLLKL